MTVPLSPTSSSSKIAISAKSTVENLHYSSCGKVMASSFEDVSVGTEHSSVSAAELSITLPELDYPAESSSFQKSFGHEGTNSDIEHAFYSSEMVGDILYTLSLPRRT
jgi:hypothetical protein